MSNYLFAFFFKSDIEGTFDFNMAIRMLTTSLNDKIIKDFLIATDMSRDEVVIKIFPKDSVVPTRFDFDELVTVTNLSHQSLNSEPLFVVTQTTKFTGIDTIRHSNPFVSSDYETALKYASRKRVTNKVKLSFYVHKMEQRQVAVDVILNTDGCLYDSMYDSSKPVCSKKELSDLSDEDREFLARFTKPSPKTTAQVVSHYQKQMSAFTNSLFARQAAARSETIPSLRKLKVYDHETERWVRASCATGTKIRTKAREWGFPCEVHDMETGKIYYA